LPINVFCLDAFYAFVYDEPGNHTQRDNWIFLDARRGKMCMTDIYLEIGEKKIFACSLNWPGWCRFGKTEGEAVQALLASTSRYRVIARLAGLEFEPGDLVVAERVRGGMATNFGAPSSIVAADTDLIDATTAERSVALLWATWTRMDEVVAASPNDLRKGPRGGGRDRDEIVRHVVEVERVYARKIGVRHKPFSPSDQAARTALREEIAAVLSKPSDGTLLIPGGWPASYAIRRITWHVIDHIWEIEDRQT
jgi:hypothetical protein